MLRETIRDQRWMTNGRRLDSWLALKPNTPVLHVYGILHVVAAVLLTELVGLFLHERGKGVQVAGNRFPGLFLGLDQRLVQRFDLLPLGGRVGALHCERSLLVNARRGHAVAADFVHGIRW